MNNGQGSIFGGQQQQQVILDAHFHHTPPEVIIQSLNELSKWVPMTNHGHSVLQLAVGLIAKLQQTNQHVINDPYWKLRLFGEAQLKAMAMVDYTSLPYRTKKIFFYDYENNAVYLGLPADLEHELPPVVLRAVIGVEGLEALNLDEAVKATQEACNRLQSWVFEMVPKEEPAPSPYASWEFLMRIEENPFESSFEMNFRQMVDDLGVPDPKMMYQTFKDKFNLNAILNGANRPFLDLHVFCVDGELHWDWVTRK